MESNISTKELRRILNLLTEQVVESDAYEKSYADGAESIINILKNTVQEAENTISFEDEGEDACGDIIEFKKCLNGVNIEIKFDNGSIVDESSVFICSREVEALIPWLKKPRVSYK